MAFVLKHLMVFWLCFGILLPKVTGVLYALHPNITQQVICTGSEMITIRVGPDGVPIKVNEDDSGPCVLADPNIASLQVEPAWVALSRQYEFGFVPVINPGSTTDHLLILPESHGPPRLI